MSRRAGTWPYPGMIVNESMVPPGLVATIAEGRPIVLLGRNSNPSGRTAFDYAASDLIGAAEELARRGIDVRDALPSKQQMMDDLKNTKPQRVERRDGVGKPLQHRFVRYDMRARFGVELILCAGTGKTLDHQFAQPWVTELAGVVQQANAGLLFAKERHRFARVTWAAGPLFSWIAECLCWLGSGDRDLTLLTSAAAIQLFFDLTAAEEQGRKLPIESRRGMRGLTDPTMINGRATIGVGHTPPPGLAVVRLKIPVGRSAQLLILDSAEYRPDESTVATGWPAALDAEGSPANQVEAVRYVLANAYRPGWVRMDIVRELRRRGFATQKLRYQHRRDDVTIRDISDPNAIGMIRSLLRHLDFYETGLLQFPFGLDGVEDAAVSGCMPLGGWATAEDFERIREGVAGDERPRRHYRFAFTGLAVSIGDETYRLRSRPRTHDRGVANPVPRYNLEPAGTTAKRPRVTIPHSEIAQWYSSGIAAAGSDAFPLVDTSRTPSSPAVAELFERRSVLENELVAVQSDADRLITRIAATDGAVSKALEHRYNSELDPRLSELDVELHGVDQEIKDERRKLDVDVELVAADKLLELVATLRDAESAAYRDLLIPATRNASYSSTREVKRGVRTLTHRLTGELVVGSGSLRGHISLDHSWTSGAGANVVDRAPEVLAQLRSGVAFNDVDIALAQYSRPALAELLGVRSEKLLFPRILDGRITAAVAHVIYGREGRSSKKLAVDLGEPVEFVERIAELYREPPPRWCRGNAKYLVATYASAANNDGVAQLTDIRRWAGEKRARLSIVVSEADDGLELLYGLGYRVPPCSNCGSHRLAPLKIREPVGPVCLDCRLDRRGLVWPADPYDRYLAEPGVWALASASCC